MQNKHLAVVLALAAAMPLAAHGGKRDNLGGHYNRKAGNYHYHSGKYAGHTVASKGDVPKAFQEKEKQQPQKRQEPTPKPKPEGNKPK
jgi:hypothetical protein